jgi:hypothetical protein
MTEEASVTVDFDSETDTYAVKIGLAKLEVNVLIPRAEVEKLGRVRDALWDERGSLRIGSTLGNSVFWCTDPITRDVWLLVSPDDDETWEVALALPPNTADAIVAAIHEPQP